MKLALLDIDGCLSDPEHRLHLWKDPDRYEEFVSLMHKDPLIPQGVWIYRLLLLHQMPEKFRCVFITSRNEDQRTETAKILERTFGPQVLGDALLWMRPSGDSTPCGELKYRLLIESGHKPEDVFIAFDDFDDVIAMWRRHGIVAYQTAARSE